MRSPRCGDFRLTLNDKGPVNSATKICLAVDLGVIPYKEGVDLQTRLVAARLAGTIGDVLLVCQHRHVITFGRNSKREHLLASNQVLEQMSVEVQETDRGGDITYHGPGQVVGYPILNLGEIRRDVEWYVRQLEEVMIRATADFGATARRIPGMTGIWVDAPRGQEKLGALGVHISRWVTSHGFAYNVATDLRYFELIVPCGLEGKRATSLESVIGRAVPVWAAAQSLDAHFGDIFGFRMQQASRGQLEAALAGHAVAAP